MLETSFSLIVILFFSFIITIALSLGIARMFNFGSKFFAVAMFFIVCSLILKLYTKISWILLFLFCIPLRMRSGQRDSMYNSVGALTGSELYALIAFVIGAIFLILAVFEICDYLSNNMYYQIDIYATYRYMLSGRSTENGLEFEVNNLIYSKNIIYFDNDRVFNKYTGANFSGFIRCYEEGEKVSEHEYYDGIRIY